MEQLAQRYPDDDEAKPFFELVSALGIPVMMHAPSVGFMQPWDFIVIRDASVRQAVHRNFERACRRAAEGLAVTVHTIRELPALRISPE